MIAPNEEAALSKLKVELRRNFRLVDFVLFGSKARGEETDESDIDVMIELEDCSPELISELDDIVFGINLEHDCLISTVIFSRKELEEGPMSESPLYRVIMKDGIRL